MNHATRRLFSESNAIAQTQEKSLAEDYFSVALLAEKQQYG